MRREATENKFRAFAKTIYMQVAASLLNRPRLPLWMTSSAMSPQISPERKLPLAALFINDCNWCKWTSRRSILSIEKSCFRDKMRLPSSLVFLSCSRINFPCSLINRETACKALLLWYDSEPNQQKTANIDPKRTFFPVNSLLTGKMRGDWLVRDCPHCQNLNMVSVV